MSDFNYKDLSGSIHLGLLGYTRELQDHALELEDELAEALDELATSSNQALQRRAAIWAEKWQDLNIEIGQLSREKIENEAKLNAEIERLQREVDYLEQQLEQYKRADNPVKAPIISGRDPKTGRFDTSIPARDKPYKAWLMKEQGYNPTQIAVKLNISKDTAKRYIRAENAKRGNSDTPDLADDEKPGVYLA